MSVVLLGYRGCGKSSVGRLLAEQTGQLFLDTDHKIVGRVGMTIKEIFERQGEAAFRDHEAAVLSEVLQQQNVVIALGGGVVLRAENRDALRRSGHARIYLQCDAATLHARIHADPATEHSRPALTHLGGNIDEVRRLLAEREPLYREVMTEELATAGLSREQVVSRIFETMPRSQF